MNVLFLCIQRKLNKRIYFRTILTIYYLFDRFQSWKCLQKCLDKMIKFDMSILSKSNNLIPKILPKAFATKFTVLGWKNDDDYIKLIIL